jgi:HK97 family phage major capsid protein
MSLTAEAEKMIEAIRANDLPEIERLSGTMARAGVAERKASDRAAKRLPMGEMGIGVGGDYAPYRPLNLSDHQRRQIAAEGTGAGTVLDTGEFKSLGQFAKTISPQRIAIDGLPASLRQVRNDYSSLIGAGGGDLIPEVLRAQMLKISLEKSIVRSRALVIPMDSLTVPFPVVVDSSHVSTVFGGISGQWVPESGALPESDAAFGRILLHARKLAATAVVPNELLQDSGVSLEAYINTAYPAAIAYFEDIAFLTGDGAGQPLGVLNSDALVVVDKEAGQVAGTILWENITKIFSRMLPTSYDNAVWVASISCWPELATMALSVGTGGSAIFLQNGAGSMPPTILGRPLIFTEKLPSVGTTGDIILADFSQYLVGDRMAMSMVASPHVKFQNDQTVFRAIQRVDGRPWLLSPQTPHGGGPTLSPFVTIATRA